MIALDVLGLVAGTLTTAAFMPQVIKIYRTRQTRDLSLGMFLIFSCGLILWTIYGLFTSSLPIILANFVTLMLATYIITMKIRHK